MIDRERAIEKVRETLESDMDVMRDKSIEKDYGWVLFPQTKEFIKTRNILHSAVGSGGVLVLKKSGKLINFGSGYSTEQNLEIYEKGYFDFDNWDIVITRVNDIQRTIEHLMKLRISYIEPEEAHGTIWKISKDFKHKDFKNQLKSLPARFNLGDVYFQFPVLESLKNQKDFIYKLEGNSGFENCI